MTAWRLMIQSSNCMPCICYSTYSTWN